MAVPAHFLALLLALAQAPQGEPAAAAQGARVVGHVRINGASRFAGRAAAFYSALGMGERLLTRERVLELLGRGFPAPDLAGVARGGACGALLIDDGSARLRGAPFCEIADRRSFLASAGASGFFWQEGPARLAPAREGAVAGEGARFVAEYGGGLLLLPTPDLIGPALEYARERQLFELPDEGGDVSVRLALAGIRSRGDARAAGLQQALEAVALALEVLGQDSRPASLAARGVGASWGFACQWDDLEMHISLDQDAVRARCFLVPRPAFPAAQWLASAQALPAGPWPGRPKEAVLALECSGDGAQLGQLLAACAGLDASSEIIEVLTRSSGDVGFYVAPGPTSAGLSVIASCPDAASLGERFGAALRPGEVGTRVVAGERAGAAWAVGQEGGWSVFALGQGAAESATAAVQAFSAPAPQLARKPAGEVVVRASASLTGLLALFWPRAGPVEEGAASAASSALSLEGVLAGDALRVDLVLPVVHLGQCVPELRTR